MKKLIYQKMYYIPRLILFWLAFTVLFITVRVIDNGLVVQTALGDLGGIPWLFSSLGLIFGILSAFVIQKQWENWENLRDAMQNEVYTLIRLDSISVYLHPSAKADSKEMLTTYLHNTITLEWIHTLSRETEEIAQKIIFHLRDLYFSKDIDEQIATHASALFMELFSHRLSRLQHMTHKLPAVLKRILLFNISILVLLSLFIGVNNEMLDFLFTISFSTLVFLIYLIVDDLDHILQNGSWHVTPRPYQLLLEHIS